jgi:hypothetical protein
MGWIEEKVEGHDEGVAVGVLASGAVATYLIGDYRAERTFMNGGWDGPAGEPEEFPAFLRPKCSCGWRGEDIPVSVDGDGLFDQAMTGYDENKALAVWEAHVAAAANRNRDEELFGNARKALLEMALVSDPVLRLRKLDLLEVLISGRKEHAVGQARAEGRPWSVIAEALDVSKSAAHARYSSAIGEGGSPEL